MAGFKLNVVSGIRPRMPESLLPEHAATVAENCDFAYGELRNVKAGYALTTLTNAAASIYTDDGLSFYSWTTDVDAVRSPMVADKFNRLYYTGDGFKFTDRAGVKTTGGTPSWAYFVGTPRPTIAPVLTAMKAEEVTSSNAKIAFKFHYEHGGVKYQEQDITPTVVNNTQYQFTAPSRDTATPDQAFPVLRITANWLRDSAQVFDLYTENSSFDGTGGLYSLSMSKQKDGSYIATLTQGIKESDKETRAYVFTQVNVYDEEGPPSDPAQVTTSPLLPVQVQVTKNQLNGYAPIKEIRIYRTGTGTTLTDYFYAGKVAVQSDAVTFQVTDSTKAELLNEVLSSLDYYPPDQSLKGLMSLPNGILCAWKGNELHFSEAYKPWAWPPKYVKTLTHPVFGGIAHGSGAIVTTTAMPYMVSGVSPDSMTASKINVNQAGVSKWSIAVVNGSVVYASNDGLVTINGATGSLDQSSVFFTRDVWRARYSAGLSSMRFSVWDGRLIVFSASGKFVPFMIRFDEANGTMTDLTSFSAQCSFVSVLSDQMYYALGTTLYQFNGGDGVGCTWQSREMVIPKPVNFGAAQVVSEGSWAVQFWAYVQTKTGWEYQLKFTQLTTTGTFNFRLPSGYESDRYRIRVTGTGRFRELRVAQTARELATL